MSVAVACPSRTPNRLPQRPALCAVKDRLGFTRRPHATRREGDLIRCVSCDALWWEWLEPTSIEPTGKRFVSVAERRSAIAGYYARPFLEWLDFFAIWDWMVLHLSCAPRWLPSTAIAVFIVTTMISYYSR